MKMPTHINNVTLLKTEEEYLDAAVSLLTQSSKYVRIRSAVLDPSLFDKQAFNEALSAFARKSRYSEVHILIDLPDVLLKRGHRTLELMRRLTQKITIKAYFDEANEYRDSYILSDSRGILIKPTSQEEDGYLSLSNAVFTKNRLETFNYEWQRSSVARQLRTMII